MTTDMFGADVESLARAAVEAGVAAKNAEKLAIRMTRYGGYKCKGFPAPPGTGPDGETCKTCANSHPNTGRTARTFWKCKLTKETGGPGSDIAINAPACRHWVAK